MEQRRCERNDSRHALMNPWLFPSPAIQSHVFKISSVKENRGYKRLSGVLPKLKEAQPGVKTKQDAWDAPTGENGK